MRFRRKVSAPPRRSIHREQQLAIVARRSTVRSAVWAGALVAVCLIGLMRRKKRTLQEGIADFYDASTGVWVEIWGDHLHHGYYEDLLQGLLISGKVGSGLLASNCSYGSGDVNNLPIILR